MSEEIGLVEMLNQLREYLLHKARWSIAKIYLDWAIGGVAGYITTSYLRGLGESMEMAIPFVWAVIGILVFLDYRNSVHEVMRLQKILGIKIIESRGKGQLIGWGIAVAVMLTINALFGGYSDLRVFMTSLLVMIGIGNVAVWLSTRKLVEPLLVGISLLIASPVPLTLSQSLSEFFTCMFISGIYAVAAFSIIARWRPEDGSERSSEED